MSDATEPRTVGRVPFTDCVTREVYEEGMVGRGSSRTMASKCTGG
jgi:hypothetical protein